MTEITPFPENNYETVLLDRPEGVVLFSFSGKSLHESTMCGNGIPATIIM